MAAEKSHAAEAASGGMPQFAIETWVGQIFWLFLTFGIMYFILSKFILPIRYLSLGSEQDNHR